jgi:hypothetical protein
VKYVGGVESDDLVSTRVFVGLAYTGVGLCEWART